MRGRRLASFRELVNGSMEPKCSRLSQVQNARQRSAVPSSSHDLCCVCAGREPPAEAKPIEWLLPNAEVETVQQAMEIVARSTAGVAPATLGHPPHGKHDQSCRQRLR